MIAHMREKSPLTGCPDGVLRPAEENGSLGDVERSGAILEHLWNKTAVHGWGPLVRIGFNGCDAPLNESARLATVGEVRGRLLTWSVRLAKAKVAGSKPVFRSI